ncbi:hypothetical protein H0H93_011533 [Arthromyces matolae]|nr:hypothetical protein H0H93_011533 [Arthromyces matolae]
MTDPRGNTPGNVEVTAEDSNTSFFQSEDPEKSVLLIFLSLLLTLCYPNQINFEEGDRRNPINFTRRRKWAITVMACIATFFASSIAGAYNMGFDSMTRDLNCTQFQATIGLSVYALGFGLVPLVSASFSEEFGRQPLYIVSVFMVTLMFMMVALAKNIQTVIVARFIQGAFGSTGSTMVGGTIADIWSTKDRGLPMSLFALVAMGGTGVGPAFAGWIEMNTRLEWRWIQWIQMMFAFVSLPLSFHHALF